MLPSYICAGPVHIFHEQETEHLLHVCNMISVTLVVRGPVQHVCTHITLSTESRPSNKMCRPVEESDQE